MNYDMFDDRTNRARSVSDALRQAAPVLGEVGASLAPGAGAIDAAGGYYSPMAGQRLAGWRENWGEGNYGTALTQLLGAGGDAATLVPGLGLAAGAVMRAPRALQKGRQVAKMLSKKEVRELADAAGEADIGRSFASGMKGSEGIPASEVAGALRHREQYRAEPRTLPKPAAEMSDQDWLDFGAQYGADFSQSPMQSLGMSDLATRQELMVPGGLEGQFTIPDLFRIKAQNFDPRALEHPMQRQLPGYTGSTHNELMKKFLRTYRREGEQDAVDVFNDLNFALLSPNAPLTQNEFLAQRLRAQSPEDLERLAERSGELNLGNRIDAETGVGAAQRGGMGVKGTADLGNQAELARLLRERPDIFQPGEGETLRDVAYRVMNQVPGLGVKTASLGVPWTNLDAANVSAVDLHMIRNLYPRLKAEDPAFAARLKKLTGAMRKDKKTGKMSPMSEEDAAIDIIGGTTRESVYRPKAARLQDPETGLHKDLPDYIRPEKLAHEPEKFSTPNEFYSQILRYIDESRGPNPELELFPEQWRLWDTYRARVEPHEMAHPDWRKLPKQSWSEMQEALGAHRELGYMDAPDKQTLRNAPVREGDWRKLYYGHADPRLLMGVAGAGLAGSSLAAMLRNKQQAMEEQGLTNEDRSRY